MPSSHVMSIIRNFVWLCPLREIEGNPLPEDMQRTIPRLSVYNSLKRERLRIRSLANAVHMKRKRRWWIRSVLLDRKVAGAWFTLIPEMRDFDPDAHFNFLTMTPASFVWWLERVSLFLTQSSVRRETISASERLAVTLRYLASSDSQISLSYLSRISDSSVSDIVVGTTAVICYVLKDQVFEPLSEAFWRVKAAEFEAMWDFLLCVAAMDGKHCFVQKVTMRGSECYIYKFGHSLILFAVCDAKYKFIVVDAGSRGRESDGGVFERSEIDCLFNTHQIQLPPQVYNTSLKSSLWYVFTGDNAFLLDTHLMTLCDESLKPEDSIDCLGPVELSKMPLVFWRHGS